MKKIEINIPGKEYPVYIGINIFDSLDKIIRSKKLFRNLFLVIDRNVMSLHREDIKRFTSNFSGKVAVHEFTSSEAEKNFISLSKLVDDLIVKGFGRDTIIIAVGGGITGDIAGFAAATYMRGIKFIQVPTTLLAAVDSSIGGKTGINSGDTKNIVGAIYQPEFVLIDTEFLKTLPEEEIICGVGEIVKYAFLIDPKFFLTCKNYLPKLLKTDSAIVSKIIDTCISFKGDVVAEDEKENGLRKILNLGHTFAHAVEIEQNFRIKHGQAVIIGLVCALDLSKRIGLLDDKLFSEYLKLPLMLKDKILIRKFDAARIYEIMKRDKKGRDHKIKFVLLQDVGHVAVDVEVSESDVTQSIQQGLNYFIQQ
ncbi:MAG: 3-dehydroquinate synthase [Melioribacteraceae bacterium]